MMVDYSCPSITIRLAGGLGNQIFQFAAAQNLLEALNCKSTKLFVNTNYLQSYEAKHHFSIGFITKHFSNINIESSSPWVARLACHFRLARFLDQRLGNFAFISTINHLQKAYMHSNYAKHFVLDGYFQDPNILFTEVQRCELRDVLLREKSDLINTIKKGKKFIGVHIRRGDYVTSKVASRVFKTIKIDYYHEALKRFPNNKQVIVFSDDRELAADFAERIGGINARHLNLSLEDEFCLLMACDDHVIANSTFSWWAAVLGQRNKGRIIAPMNWYHNQKSNKENILLLSNFELINA
jgi:hypothetical protein